MTAARSPMALSAINPLDALYDAGIRDPLRWFADIKLRNWSYLKGAFPRGIIPTDLDAIVEINGWFLILENKFLSGDLAVGQRRLFEALIDLNRTTVFVIKTDERTEPVSMTMMLMDGRIHTIEANRSRVFQACQKWGQLANNNQLGLLLKP